MAVLGKVAAIVFYAGLACLFLGVGLPFLEVAIGIAALVLAILAIL